MKIVTYNVNGLKSRISQFGSLLKLLQALDADIICFQETKLSRTELTADLVAADGYESFFSCTRRSSDRGRGYSGVATFCRVKAAFSSNEVALPLTAEEGFTGLLENSRGFGTKNDELPLKLEGLEELTKDELCNIDSEGRCVITDHGHFVLFNLYGPRAQSDDTERIQYKLHFFKILQKRWETLLSQGKRIVVVGDLNIAPFAVDRCDAGPDFEKNEFRKWLRSILVGDGGPFYDVFRAKYPKRREAYTCWAQNTGAEEFNFGSRIDHILCTRSCLHCEDNLQGHDFVMCHVTECDIMMQFKRWKPGSTPRHLSKGGKSIKLEGSDHAPVYMCLMEIPDIQQHNTPSLSTRYVPRVHGLQQTIMSVLMKRKVAVKSDALPSSFADEESSQDCSASIFCSDETNSSMNHESEGVSNKGVPLKIKISSQTAKKKTRESQSTQLSLKSFFHKSSNQSERIDVLFTQEIDESKCSKESELNRGVSNEDEKGLNGPDSSQKEKNIAASVEWQRIQQLMQNSIPLCKGHNEPCVARVVKKTGPNLGRRFYSCARAEGPASNPEANCGYFKWAPSKSKQKR